MFKTYRKVQSDVVGHREIPSSQCLSIRIINACSSNTQLTSIGCLVSNLIQNQLTLDFSSGLICQEWGLDELYNLIPLKFKKSQSPTDGDMCAIFHPSCFSSGLLLLHFYVYQPNHQFMCLLSTDHSLYRVLYLVLLHTLNML